MGAEMNERLEKFEVRSTARVAASEGKKNRFSDHQNHDFCIIPRLTGNCP